MHFYQIKKLQAKQRNVTMVMGEQETDRGPLRARDFTGDTVVRPASFQRVTSNEAGRQGLAKGGAGVSGTC